MNPAQKLNNLGTSVWYDNISRELLDNGELKRLIAEWGVVGLTSNPTIFEQAVSKSNTYNDQIAQLKSKGLSSSEIFDELSVEDIGEAADLLLPVYERTKGNDGFVSIEVSPLLAKDAAATIKEARRLCEKLKRPNVMIKIPGTEECLPAVKTALTEGINVNITLLFSLENYTKVANTYCEALRDRLKAGKDIAKVRSVASFFVSRVDTIVDSELEKLAKEKGPDDLLGLRGKFGIANCKIVYKRYQEIFETAAFDDLRAAGAAPQRPLWASTSTKNPAYRDTTYVEQLAGKGLVNTMPHVTLAALVDHGEVAEMITKDVASALELEKELLSVGVNLSRCLETLQTEGVEKFVQSFISLNKTIDAK